jgi:membrane-bound lytic murein transglycosylase MltF
MQVMPATGEELKVGDITVTEPNIHAGAKYMSTLKSRYFPEPELNEVDRTLMCFAAYNAGPARIASLRKTAAARGLDPNVWFNNMELVVAEKIGRETTTYVRNIYKYYVSYKLTQDAEAERKRVRDAVFPATDKEK